MSTQSFYHRGNPWKWGLLGFVFLLAGAGAQANPLPLNHLNIISAPPITVTGTVTSSQGEPLVGASVKIKGSNLGTTTNARGNFTLTTDSKSVLVVSYTGYLTIEIDVDNRSSIDIQLFDNTAQLNEVVVTALGIKKQAKSLGYSTTQIPGSELTENRTPNLANALSGQIAGVSVAGTGTGPAGSTRITIRGNSSLTTASTPLYIIDGVPFDASNQGSAGKWGEADYGDALSTINPDDIETINVLKGVAASSLYGYRGGNGVVLITTKAGSRSKGIGVEINNNFTANKVINYLDLQYDYGQGDNFQKPTTVEEVLNTATSSWGPKIDGSKVMNFKGEMVDYLAQKDNFKNFYKTGLSNQTTVAFSGSNAQGNFRLGLTNMNMSEIIPSAGMAQQGLNFNSNYNLTDRLHVNFSAAFMYEKVKNRPWFSDSPGSVVASTYELASSYDIRWLSAAVDENGSELLPTSSVWFNNPYFAANYFKNTSERNRYTGNLSIRYDLLDWLAITGQVNRNSFLNDQSTIVPTGTGWEPAGTLSVTTRNNRELNGSLMLEINKKIGSDFSIHANLGGNKQDNLYKEARTNGGLDLPYWYSVNNIVSHPYNVDYSHFKVNSLYGSADFGFRDYLFLTLTGRNDWFSTLNPATNNIFYPSIASSFVFSDALQMPGWISFGKLRASWAQSSGGTNPYRTALSYSNININYGDGIIFSEIGQGTVPNAFLKPINITETEIGVNMGFLNNRLNVDLAVYDKETKDDILDVTVSTTSGYGSAVQNIGKMRNRGIELLLSGDVVHSENFTWKSSFNIARNDSKVLFLSEGLERISVGDGDPARYGTFTIQQIVGESYGQLIGYKYLRDPATGQKIFGADGLPLRTDLTSLGSGVYKTTGGFTNEFRYKNFSLSSLIDFKFGAMIYSVTNSDLTSRGLTKLTLQGREGGYIGQGLTEDKQPNTVAVPAQVYWGSISGEGPDDIAEEYTYDASFIKLRNLSIGYIFPQTFLKKTPIKALTFSLVGRNLFTLLKHTPNIDPESNLRSDLSQGVEYNPYPAFRSMGFNLNIKF